MGITVKGDEALKLLELLEKIDNGYVLSEEEQAYLDKVEVFDFSEKKIRILPGAISNLTNLQELDLSWTGISTLPDSIGALSNLRMLNLSYTDIRSLPHSIGKLSYLRELNLNTTGISTLPDSIGNLSSLQKLNISSAKFKALPDSIGNLTNLQELYIFDMEIDTLPDFIGSLTKLRILSLSGRKINTFPDTICELTSLQSLHILGTKIHKLPSSIGNLSNLQQLQLVVTPISTLPDSIGTLSKLNNLELFGTSISILPDTIGNLINLQHLNLYYAPIITLPESIGNLANLQSLGLSRTKLSILPNSIGNLTNLQQLDLRDMFLQQIPRSLFELGLDFSFDGYPASGIDLSGTTLSTQPISLFHQPRELIQAYYNAPKVTINDAKVIFLGDGGVGKTYTIKRLLNGGIKEGEKKDGKLVKYPTELTPGIDITSRSFIYDSHSVDLRIWDFGGQEIMHAMHCCFLTDRTCYVVMVSNRFGNRTQRARYWLKTIDSFAKNCPVILAVNLWDTDEGIDGVNGELLEQEFPNVKKIITYSAKGSDKDHFNLLTKAIVEQADRLDSRGMEFPESWANIRADLSKKAETERYISKADYLAICTKNGETDPQICGWLLEWFNDLGVCFSYHTDKTSGQELENYQVLDPRWLVNAVYLIINRGRNFAQQSRITLKGIWDILTNGGGTSADANYKESECAYILEVMRKFHLSYQEENEKSEFIPALCPDKWEKPPQTEGWDSQVTYEMRYKYLPDSVLHQLMIYGKANRLLVQAWSGGMELSTDWNKLHAVIYLRAEESKLEINAYAKDGQKPWEILDALRNELERINNDLNLEAEDVIVIEGDKQTAHFPVAAVLKAVERHIPTLYAMDGGELEEYRVNDILGAAFDMEKVEKEKKKAEEEKRPMSEKKMSGGNTYVTNNYYGENNGNQYINSTAYTSEDAEKLLQQVLDHQERMTEQFMDTLLDILRESREQPVQKLVAEVDTAPKKKKSRLDVVRDLLSDSSNLATVASAVAPQLPTLWALAKAFLPGP